MVDLLNNVLVPGDIVVVAGRNPRTINVGVFIKIVNGRALVKRLTNRDERYIERAQSGANMSRWESFSRALSYTSQNLVKVGIETLATTTAGYLEYMIAVLRAKRYLR